MRSTVPILALLGVSGFLARANDLSLNSIALTPGSSAAMTLRFSPSPEPVVAFQFDLAADAPLRIEAFEGTSARQAGKVLYAGRVSSTRTRYLMAGLNRTATLTGPIVNFLVAVAEDADPGRYSVRLENVTAIQPNGQTAPASSTGAEIQVAPGPITRMSEAGVLHAATLLPGPVAPGEILTLMGQGIGPSTAVVPDGVSATVLGGVSVSFDGAPSPLLYAGPGQINVVTPFAVRGERTTITVRSGGVVRAEREVAVTASAPGIFTLNSHGTGAGAILNQDGTVNSPGNPARRGDIISIFATGAGAMNPPGADGGVGTGTLQVSVLPVTVRVGGRETEVLYAGAAPALIAGALQVNCRIPASQEPGPAVDVVVRVGNSDSPAGVTVAVQ